MIAVSGGTPHERAALTCSTVGVSDSGRNMYAPCGVVRKVNKVNKHYVWTSVPRK